MLDRSRTYAPLRSPGTGVTPILLSALVLVAMALSGAFRAHASDLSEFTWEWSNPRPQGNFLLDISIHEDSIAAGNRVMAVGSRGTLLSSIDGGDSWVSLTGLGGSPNDLRGIDTAFSVSDSPMVVKSMIVASAGNVLINTDVDQAPNQWVSHPTGTNRRLNDVTVVRGLFEAPLMDRWVAVGDSGTVVRTTDCGVTWEDISPPDVVQDLVAVATQFPSRITVTGENGTILFTDDQGVTWQEASTSRLLAATEDINSLAFADSTHGKASGDDGVILGTTDGGESWTVETTSVTTDLHAIAYIGGTRWCAVGSSGTVLVSQNDGTTWDPIPSGTTELLFGVSGSGDLILAVGNHGAVVRSNDGGASFEPLSSGPTRNLSAIDHLDESVAVAVGLFGAVVRTEDGGATWSEIDPGTTAGLNDVAFEPSVSGVTGSPGDGWIVANSGSILRTEDSGLGWTPQTSGTTERLSGISSPAPAVAFVCGNAGVALHTTDGGSSWTPLATGQTADLRGIHAASPETAWTVGEDGIILHTSNAGADWSPQSSGTTETLNGVHFLDSLTGAAVGTGGTVLRTEDGGATWDDVSFGQDVTLIGVVLLDADTFVAVGAADHNTWFTDDGGTTWNSRIAGTGTLFAVDSVELSSGGLQVTAVGNDGTILVETIADPSSDVDPPALGEFADGPVLLPSRPNPASTQATLAFELAHPAHARMTLHDVRGRRIRTLLDGKLAAGRHEVDVDLDGLSNGVYLYRIVAEGRAASSHRFVVLR